MSPYVVLLLLHGTLGFKAGFQCGVANRVGSKIVGGHETEVNEYPWQARLDVTITSIRYLCGGFLIDDRRVLTAAHCFFNARPPYRKAAHVVVSLGDHNMSNPTTAAVYVPLFMEAVRIHERYTPGQHEHDIAIIYLQEKVDWVLHPKIRPVCLPSATDSYQGRVAVATGWGTTTPGGITSEVLLEVNLRITPQQDCVNAYAPVNITSGMVCAGPVTRTQSGDTCQGDSGGPLVVMNDVHSQYEIAGITSWGRSCDLLQYPGVYTSVAHYIEWIQEQDMTCSIPPLPTTSVVMQRRIRGAPATAFAQDWRKYEEGFSGNGELWLGLKEVHRITSSGSFGLLVRLTDWDGQDYEAHYDSFQVGAAPDYRLAISGFDAGISSLGDSMTPGGSHNLNGMKFSTRDKDNEWSGVSCSQRYGGSGGWWFRACGYSGLNGENSQTQKSGDEYIHWAFDGDRGKSDENWAASEMFVVQK